MFGAWVVSSEESRGRRGGSLGRQVLGQVGACILDTGPSIQNGGKDLGEFVGRMPGRVCLVEPGLVGVGRLQELASKPDTVGKSGVWSSCDPEYRVVRVPLASACCAFPRGEAHLAWNCSDAYENFVEVGVGQSQRSLWSGCLWLQGKRCRCRWAHLRWARCSDEGVVR